jgi:NCS2 family nucleobase:cation symporter-2
VSSRPEDLIYALDERPPWTQLLLLGAQHAALMSVYLVLIVIVFRKAGASHAVTTSAVSLGMIALAISTSLQAIWKGPIGSGFLAAPVFSAIYLGPAILAARADGLPAVFGMTVFAGLIEVALVPLLVRLRGLFPPAISGFIVAIVGIQLGIVGIIDLLGVDHVHRPRFHDHLAVAFITLAIIVGLSIWGRGLMRLTCSMIGIACGLGLAFAFGLVSDETIRVFLDAPMVALPDVSYLSYEFDLAMVPPFLIAGSAAMLRTVGVITTCQKINDDDWKRPEMRSIRGGIIADGIGCTLAGVLGTIGTNSAPSLVGVSKGSGATSRFIAFSASAFLVVFALIPKYAVLFQMLPEPVVGAAMVFTASFMISGGIQIIVSRNVDSRTTFVIGPAMLLGLSRELFPAYFKMSAHFVQAISGSMMSLGVITAFALNLLFRIGVTRKVEFTFESSTTPLADLEKLLKSRGKAWSIAADVVDRATAATEQVITYIEDAGLVVGNTRAVLSYNDVDLVVAISYAGTLLSLPNVGIRRRIFVEEESFSYGLADFLTGVYPDRMESRAIGKEVTIAMYFRT